MLGEVLQGAWVGEGSDCTKVFEKVKGQFRFKDRTYSHDNGFIITDKKAKGPVGGSCAISQIIVDANHFERFDERGAYKHKKCSF